VSEVSVHHFHTKEFGDRTANDSGRVFPLNKRKSPDFYSSDYLQLNHYYTRSEEEFARKIKRGGVSPTVWEKRKTRLSIALENIEKDTVDDLSFINFLDRNSIPI
jgi:hypothetical protein